MPQAGLLLLLAVAASTALVYALVPPVIRVAERLEFFDKPRGYKGHATPTPYLGGSAVMAGFVLVSLVLAGEPGKTLPILAGAIVLWVVGTVDDRRDVSPGLRVVVEVALATALWAVGLSWDLGLGTGIDLLCTVFWIVAVVNAFNLFDNMDGAASTMALVVSLALAALGVIEGETWLAVSAGALAGACLGFLPFNLAGPARIFLGDGGSMPVGFAVAALAMVGASESVPAWQSLMVGLLLVGLPALDTCLVVVSRRRRGISVLTAGRDHLTHRASVRLQSARTVAVVLGGAQVLVSGLALIATRNGSSWIVFGIIAYLLAAGLAITVFERQTVQEFASTRGSAALPGSSRLGGRVTPQLVLTVVFALGAATSPFFEGFYADRLWVPIGLALVALAAVAAAARPPRLTTPGALSIAGLLGLGVLAFASRAWADSAHEATVDANRWLVLGVAFGVAVLIVRGPRESLAALWAITAGLLVVVVAVVLHLLDAPPTGFITGRLNAPLGYINGQAALFLMGFWVCFALAERTARRLPAALAASAAALFAMVAMLSQSRGAAVAAAVSLVVVLAVLPGRRRRAALLGVLVLALLPAAPTVLDVYNAGGATPEIFTDYARRGVRAMLLGSVLAGLGWAAALAFDARWRTTPARVDLVRSATSGAGIALAVLAVAGAAISSGTIADRVSDQYDAFVSLAPNLQQNRLVSGSGTRHEYWRVAVDEFTASPVIGAGGGSWSTAWFAERRTAEDVQQPHSLVFQVLAELGLLGGLLLALFFAGIVLAVLRVRRLPLDPRTTTIAVAAVGGVSAWAAQASVDWLHRLPGVTAVALLLIATLVHQPRRASAPTVPRPHHRYAVGGLALLTAVVLVLSGASLSRQGLADVYASRASDALADDPATALKEAERSLTLDGSDVETRWTKAAAQARFGDAEGATETLLQALDREPRNFVSWALLGDLRLRTGDREGAREAYEEARRLNPREPTLDDVQARIDGGSR